MNLIVRSLLILKHAVRWIAVTLLVWMILISALQLILRFVFSSGIFWIDIQLRYLVLWIGLIGGCLAAAENRHICINILEHYLTEKIAKRITQVVYALASLSLLGFGYLAVQFVLLEKEGGYSEKSLLFGWDASLWLVELVIPVSIFIMAAYFLAVTFDFSTSGKK